MALYKHNRYASASQSDAFDVTHNPGATTPYSGIYRCDNCGHEIVSEEGKPLPPQVHTKHPTDKPIKWRLIVFAQHNTTA